MPSWQQDSLLLKGTGIYSWNLSLNSMTCSAYLQGGLIKNKGGVGLFEISLKERLFISYGNYMPLGVISQCAPILHLPKKAFLSPSLWSRREHTWTLSWKENLLICFENCLGVSYDHKQSRNRMMNIFIISNITPTCQR